MSRTLCLRKLQSDSAGSLQGSTSHNIIAKEFSVLIDSISDVLDIAVMKYVGNSIPILSEQECQHAKMHREVQCEHASNGDNVYRWRWLNWIAQFFLLRCGAPLGISLCGHIEACAWVWFGVPLLTPICGFADNIYVFHGFEEIEHGALTVQCLGARSNLLIDWACFPLSVAFHFLLLLSAPVVVLLTKPGKYLHPKTYLDLSAYLCVFVPTFLLCVAAMIIQRLLRIPESTPLQRLLHAYFEKMLEHRGVKFDTIKKETYKLKPWVLFQAFSTAD
eukprot:TRINITY_DN6674_c0_g1_i2.p1 TRINITY_DN6674_c0_g1~~TRINITY_DN6674_c0_g1_i2.p1  ORF type:complete len:276 (+),score=26.42 TRINITY_DN6674_c0_g1_i2:55-882(+)